MMRRTLLSLLLLLTFGFGLVAGPHPCHEGAAAERERPGAQAQPSCHQAVAAAGPAVAKGGLSPAAGQDCCDIACQHACHMVAVVSAEPVLFAAVPLSQRVAEKAVRGVPYVVSGIDHIPLA
jgi:hypothetical protein